MWGTRGGLRNRKIDAVLGTTFSVEFQTPKKSIMLKCVVLCVCDTCYLITQKNGYGWDEIR